MSKTIINFKYKVLKASIHKSGKIGFPKETAEKMALSNDKSFGIAKDESEEEVSALYVVIYDNKTDGSFKVNKAGDYFYVNAEVLFDHLKWDYKNKNITFDITHFDNDGVKVYKFEKSEKARN